MIRSFIVSHSIVFVSLSAISAGAAADDTPGDVGETYHVDSQLGDDANNGSSRNSAFRTLKRAVAALNGAGGDTLVIRGTFHETLNLTGINYPRLDEPDPNRQTVIRCDADSEGKPHPAIIDGGIPPAAESFPFDCQGKRPGFGPDADNRYLDRGIIIAQCNGVTVDGITVRGIAGLGVLMWRASHVVLRNLTVEWTSQSALMLSHGRPADPMVRDLTVEYCRVNQSNLGFWRDRENADPRKRGYEMRSETVSLVRWDGFNVHHNHISNSLMEGIDFKEGSSGGEIHHNIVEQCRSAGIYANEGRDAKIYRNIVRRIGYYDPQNGEGLFRGGAYLAKKLPGSNVGEPGATGILISNGDLDGPGRPPLEVGRVSGIEVYENVVSWTRKAAVSVWNEWRKERRDGWVIDRIRIDNNTCYKTCLGPNPVSAAVSFDAAATNLQIRNNIIAGSAKYDLEMWNRPHWPQPESLPHREITHNLFHANAMQHTSGDHPIQGDPLFVKRPEALGDDGDFQLQDGSPGRDAGVDTELPHSGDPPKDIGAYEHGREAWGAGVIRRDGTGNSKSG
ncbi:MAG: right-handed parallel beta-helix repeat-containing protein [Planctomycetota bacterium]